MLCPNCSYPQTSAETKFCSRCGFEMEGVNQPSKMAMNLGEPEKEELKEERVAKLSPRQRGLRQGVMLMLLSLILVPAYVLLAALFPANDVLIESHVSDTAFEKISQAILFTIFMCGLARTLYAYFFEQGQNEVEASERTAQINPATMPPHALPSASGIPVSGFGAWRANTGEVLHPLGQAESGKEFLREE